MNKRSYALREKSHSSFFGGKRLFLLFLAIGLSFFGIRWFRHQADARSLAPQEDTTAIFSLTAAPPAPNYRAREEASLTNVDGVNLAVASRTIEDAVFHHTIVAHLADPPLGMHYQGWLVREEPFAFFTTGTMEKNADGTFALIWDGQKGKGFLDYEQIVVTQEPDGEESGPSAHVLEGAF